MIRKTRRTLRELRSSTSGNAALLVALGMPALIGSAGLAVDVAQWYEWKRELQYAVDQGALAGAYARAYDETKTQYATRATQEYNTNLTSISEFASSPTIALAKFGGSSTNNSVTIFATASKRLPFSSYLINRPITVRASAQATFSGGNTYTACLIAVDPDDDGSITFNGSSIILKARCGIASLSTSAKSVVVNGGSPYLDVGWVVSAGGIDDYFDTLTGTTVQEYLNNLIDPFASLTPPNNTTPQTYTCSKASSYQTTTGTETLYTWTKNYSGDKKNSLSLTSTSSKTTKVTTITPRPTAKADVQGSTTGTVNTVAGAVVDNGASASPRYTEADSLSQTDTNYTITTTNVAEGATMNPGTYSKGVKIACNTVMNPGIYVMDGGDFESHASYTLTGNGIMIVLKNSAGIIINGGANQSLTAMTAVQLQDAGLDATTAGKLAGMLVFEDPASNGVTANHNKINGNASTVLNGTIYLPKSDVSFGGTANVTSQCLMIAAKNITIQGDLNMETFCPPGLINTTAVSTSNPNIRLVA